ncbi:hypothetical protein ACFXOX_23620 [Bacillus subtilis]
MTTVVVVHGTGVREVSYQQTLERVRAGIDEHRPDIVIKPCFWGGRLGASLECKGLSIPEGHRWQPKDRNLDGRQWHVARWALLEADPQYELRILSIEYAALAGARRGDVEFAEAVEDAVLALSCPDPGLEPYFSEGRRILLADKATRAALTQADPDEHGAELGSTLAWALVAHAVARCTEATGEPPLLSGVRRLLLVQEIENRLRLRQLGLRETVKYVSGRMAGAVATRMRSRVLEAAHPMAADILLYLSRGENIRQFVRQTAETATGPVVLLAHSLGGIICLDLAIMGELPGVALLVTVGSQGPLLYELDVLTSLRAGKDLPVIPRWVNFYDMQDPLAYVGERLFPGRVRDVLVDNESPFPGSHTEYFDNSRLYDSLIPLLP